MQIPIVFGLVPGGVSFALPTLIIILGSRAVVNPQNEKIRHIFPPPVRRIKRKLRPDPKKGRALWFLYAAQTVEGEDRMSQTAPRRPTLLSSRVPRDVEHERYHPELEEEIKECLYCLRRNAMMFDLEVDPDLVEQRIYERQALLCRYRYLIQRARELGLHTILAGLPAFGDGSP